MTAVGIPRVLSAGSAVLDRVVNVENSVDQPGGAALNVAFGVRRLGAPTTLMAAVAEDAAGTVLRDRLAHEGIELVDAGDGRATTIAESRRTADTVSYSFSSSVPSGLLALADAHLELIRTAPVVVMSAMRAGQRLGALLGTLDAAQGLSLYDPNPRPRTSADLIAHRAEFEEISRRADIVKVAREDLELLFDRPAEETIDRLRTRVGVLLVSDGPRGIVLHAGRARIAVPSSIRAERVVDPLGAGDATLAAVAVQLAGHGVPRTERGWRGVLTFAMRVAAIVCATPGGAMSMPAADALT